MIRFLKVEMGIAHCRDKRGSLYALKSRTKTCPCVVAGAGADNKEVNGNRPSPGQRFMAGYRELIRRKRI
ncbi:hypothetical protein AAH048_12800 [Parabacteroides merdae]|uniref:hypothetical protein n=1 Tax=Bacteroidales TaxID=171549 RepID=UPI00105918F3|nr:hypothetical protein [Bacteroides sp. AM44-19]